jgi:hypothetical protein
VAFVSGFIARSSGAPSDRAIRSWFADNEATLTFSAGVPKGFNGNGQVVVNFDVVREPARDSTYAVSAFIDEARKQVVIERGHSAPDYAVVPFATILAR